jgi:alpha-N-acetylglucosamine transferase
VNYSIYGPEKFLEIEEKPLKKVIVTNIHNDLYVVNALVLGYTLQKYNTFSPDVELLALVPYQHSISPRNLERLKEIGWRIRHEHDIVVAGIETLKQAFQRNFIKLRVWSWTEYAKVVWIDADCIVTGDISLLLSTKYCTSPT